MNKNILITGATGLLGSELLKNILLQTDSCITLLVRYKNGDYVERRIERIMKNHFANNSIAQFKNRITVLEGDITKENLGLSSKDIGLITKNIAIIYHCAAVTSFTVPLDKATSINVTGTNNVVNLALKCYQKDNLQSFNYISSITVSGTYRGMFFENYLDVGQKFNNNYERTKYEAELLLNKHIQHGFPAIIYRPSFITGHSITGETSIFKMLYQIIHLCTLEIFSEIPADKSIEYNLIPVDYAVRAIYFISQDKEAIGKTFHIVSPNDISLEFIVNVASKLVGFDVFKMTPISKFDMSKLSTVQKEILKPYSPYLNTYFVKFDTTNLQSALKDELNFSEINEDLLKRLINYYLTKKFIKTK